MEEKFVEWQRKQWRENKRVYRAKKKAESTSTNNIKEANKE